MEKTPGPTGIQDNFLGRMRKERSWVTILLISGRKISGRIRSYDRYTVLLESRGLEQMVFKHAIASISIAQKFSNTIDLEKEKARPAGGEPEE